MSEQPTTPLPDDLVTEARWYRRPLTAVRFWENREMPPMLGQRWQALTGPWGRFYACIGLALAFVYRPTTWGALAGIALVTLVASFGRRHWFWYAVPIGAVGIGTGSGEWMAAAAGLLIFGHRWANRVDRPDALAMRLHLRLAELDGSPKREEFWRLETFAEARDRLLTFLRGGKGFGKMSNPFYRIRKLDHRPLNPVPHWLRIYPEDPRKVADGAYPYRGFWRHYPASCPDDNPDWQQRYLDAFAAKLPPMTIPGSDVAAPPGLIGAWHTAHDYVDITVARPMPAWCTLADLPELPWDGVVPVGLTSPDYPVGTVVEGVAVAVWNLYSDTCPVPPEAHAMVVGPTGSYKTSAVRTLVHGLREHLGADIDAIDGKGEGAFAYLDGQAGCRETADPAQGKALLLDAYQEMAARYAVNDQERRQRKPLTRWRPQVLVIDEGMSWLDQLEGDPDIDQIIYWLADISRRGRTARVSIIWSTQRPDVRNVQGKGTVGQMRDNLGFRLAGAGITEIGARMIYGDSNGALAARIPKRPRARMGLMIGQDANQFGIIQLAYTPDPLARDTDADGRPGPYADRARPPDPPPPAEPNNGGTPRNRLRVVTP